MRHSFGTMSAPFHALIDERIRPSHMLALGLLLLIMLFSCDPWTRTGASRVALEPPPDVSPPRPAFQLGALRFGGALRVPGEIRLWDLSWGGDMRLALEQWQEQWQRVAVQAPPSPQAEVLSRLRVAAALLWLAAFGVHVACCQARDSKRHARAFLGHVRRGLGRGLAAATAVAERLLELLPRLPLDDHARQLFSLEAAHQTFEDDILELHAPGQSVQACGHCEGRLGRRETFMAFGRAFCSESCREQASIQLLDQCKAHKTSPRISPRLSPHGARPSASPLARPPASPLVASPLRLPKALLGGEDGPPELLLSEPHRSGGPMHRSHSARALAAVHMLEDGRAAPANPQRLVVSSC